MTLLDRYALTTLVKETAVVRVHRGYRKADGHAIIAKILRDEFPTDLQLARLRHEHEILTSLEVPGVVKTHGLEATGNGLALILDDAGEQSLDRILHTERPPLRRALQIAVAIARTLARVHERNVLHKDIKPQHVFLDPKDPTRVTLIDFGIATRLTRERQGAALLDRLEGSLPYVAPEQTGRLNRVIDRRSDLYSLGAVLFELFTGRLPFPITDPVELVHAHLARTPEAPLALRPDLPPVLSEIILKLLKKSAESRYQSALGLASDLARCLEALEVEGSVATFPLGEHDADGELRLPQRLYGRDAELGQLVAAYDRVKDGATELVLLTGHPGVGKTALVYEFRAHLLNGGRFVAAAFEYLDRSAPYAALGHACQELVRAELTQPADALSARKHRLLQALGANAQLMIELVPELALIIGPQPPVPELGPAEAQHRFELVFQRFLLAFTGGGQPLVLFFDDLQWADAASLRLLNQALTAPEARGLLVLGASRDDAISSTHPLSLAREEARRGGARVDEIALGPLGPTDVAAFIGDTLGQGAPSVAPLAAVSLEKTRGNPLFLGQLLMTLAQSGALWFDTTTRAWSWDIAKANATVATDNVVDLVLKKLDQLGDSPRRLLQVAACIGYAFDSDLLASVLGDRSETMTEDLWSALDEGLLVPLDANYRYGLSPDAPGRGLTARFQFLHSRVQQAADQQLEEADRSAIHLAIGRRLLGDGNDVPDGAAVFDIADHMNRARALITEAPERHRLAKINLIAGRAARSAAASEAAARHLAVTIELLGEAGWTTDHRSLLDAHLLAAECEYQNGQVNRSLALLDAIEQHAPNLLDRIPARNIRSHLLTNMDRLRDAVHNSVETLRLLGDSVPSPDDPAALGAAIGAEFAAFQAERGDRPIASLANLPEMVSPEHLALLDTYAKTIPSAFQSVKELMVVVVLKAARLQLRHGRAPLTAFLHNQYGLVHTIITGDFDTGYQFGRLGVELGERAGNAALTVPARFIFSGFLSHWRDPVAVSIDQLRIALRQGLEVGDRFHSNYAVAFIQNYCFYAGVPLAEIERDLPFAFDLANRTDDVMVRSFLLGLRQAIRALQGRTLTPDSLNDDDFDAAAFEAEASIPVRAWYGAAKASVQFLAGNFQEALETTEQFLPLPNILYNAEYKLYHALSLAELARSSCESDRPNLLARLRVDAATIATWAESCPANHEHRSLLVQAELAAAEGDVLLALTHFDRAIDRARVHGFVHHQALANELCARFLLEQGRSKIARPYLIEARYAYDRWGATAKTRQLDDQFPDLVAAQAGLEVTRSVTSSHNTAATTALSGLDLTAVIRATETIASELVLERVLERLMRSLIEHAGAQRGFLILNDDDATLRLAATITVSPDEVQIGLSEPIDQATGLSSRVVRYVARTGQPAVLNDTVMDACFKGDPYIERHHPKSVLCVPMSHRGRLRGVLYLENNLTTTGFTPARVRLLQFLAVQAAVAVDNARLYGELNVATAGLRRANETLEYQVTERTAELQRALSEVWGEMDLARKIQTVLLPKDQRVRDYDIAATMLPADSVGGDYYDVIPTADSCWVVIGDVSGHGVSAGLIMMMFQTAIRTLVATSSPADADRLSPAKVLSRANVALLENLERVGKGQYLTVTALEFKGPEIRFSGLHLDILLHRAASGVVERIETTGLWLGLIDDISPLLVDRSLHLEPGDTLLLYTDGLTEARTGEGLLGLQPVAHRFGTLAASGISTAAIVKGLLGVLDGCTVNDDVTVMAVRYAPAGPATNNDHHGQRGEEER